MLKKIIPLMHVCCCLSFNVQAHQTKNNHSSEIIYKQIKDIYHPTFQDYYAIQDYLSHGKREGLEKLKDTECRQRNFKIIGDTPDKMPEDGIIPVNSDIDDKENCLVLYASFNMHYPEGLKRLIRIVKESDFKGHILYHFGGWPDLDGGSLSLAHVPFAFKVCCFKEAQRLGYKRILWLDCSVIPVVSLNTIFTMIAEKGYFSLRNCHYVGPYCNPETAAYFGYSLKETYSILSCQAGFLGVDLTSKHGKKIIALWHKAARDESAFYSARSDQTALSLILHKCGLTSLPDLTENSFEYPHLRHDYPFTEYIPERCHPRHDTLFLVDRNFVQH